MHMTRLASALVDQIDCLRASHEPFCGPVQRCCSRYSLLSCEHKVTCNDLS